MTTLDAAVGDALGAGYEYRAAPPAGQADMIGGGLGDLETGEWTDDTAQAVPILQAFAAGADLRTREGREPVAAGWLEWFAGPPADIGRQTRAVMRAAARKVAKGWPAAAALTDSAEDPKVLDLFNAAGNGALMRTFPIALGYLHDPAGCAQAAHDVAVMTHPNPLSFVPAILWSEAIRRTILTGTGEPADGLELLTHPDARTSWKKRLDEVDADDPRGNYGNNGFAPTTLQVAWWAVVSTASFEDAVQAAVSRGGDTDTVACIAGALAGARYGLAAIPGRWLRIVHGWPELDAHALLELTAGAMHAAEQR
jgi:ADP-ribosylglycohydrolase